MTIEGDSPVFGRMPLCTQCFRRVGLLGSAVQIGGKFHQKLNIGGRPIANKYCEGKMKSA